MDKELLNDYRAVVLPVLQNVLIKQNFEGRGLSDALELEKDFNEILRLAEKALDSQWIPITYRPLTVKERIAFAEHFGIEYCDTVSEKAFDCPMPKDRQEILISASWGVVEDVADNDIDGEGFICYGLAGNGDWDGVDAWMPKPEAYKKEGAENEI